MNKDLGVLAEKANEKVDKEVNQLFLAKLRSKVDALGIGMNRSTKELGFMLQEPGFIGS